MPLHLHITVDAEKAYRKLSRVRRSPTTGRGRMKEAADELLARMHKEGTLSHKWFGWASERQRIAWFASDGFTLLVRRPKGYRNVNDRFVRHKTMYTNGWVEEPYGKLGYTVLNPLPSAIYVAGDATGKIPPARQHQGRWPTFVSQIEIVWKYLPKVVSTAIRRFIDDDRG